MQNKPSIAVIGLGITGASIAAHLSTSGYAVTGYEQYDAANQMGSSHGENRLFRRVPAEGDVYVEMAARAIELWPQIERESGANLFIQNGCLDIATHHDDWANRSFALAQKYGVAAKQLSAEKARSLLPVFNFSSDMHITFTAQSGIIKAEESILAFANIAENYGADLRFSTPIAKIDMHNKNVTDAQGVTEKFDFIIIAAGGWVKNLCPDIPAVVEKSVMGWYTADQSSASLPGFSFKDRDKGFYGMGAASGQSFKIGHARRFITIDDLSVKQPVLQQDKDVLDQGVQFYFNGLQHDTPKYESGIITHMPDGNFLIDRHPDNENILIFSPCSGHGFKYAPVYGEIAEAMIQEQQDKLAFSLDEFSLTRLTQ